MIDTVFFTALILVFLRMLTFFIIVPIFYPKGVPTAVKVMLPLVVSFILLPTIDYSNVANIANTYVFVGKCISEVITGLTLGFLTNLCFMAVRIGGNMMDIQAGFAMLSLFDPSSNSNVTLIEKILYMFSMMIFFVIDGHHILIKTLTSSFNIIHIGNFILNQESIMVIIKAFVKFFTLGVEIALPIVLILVITDLVLGLVARTVPQLNVMILGLPLKILIALGCLALSLPLILKLISSVFNMLPDAINGFYKAIPMIIIFASDDKTEEATPRKKQEAKKKGQVAKSKEIALGFTLLAVTLVLMIMGDYFIESLKQVIIQFLNGGINSSISYGSLKSLWVVGLINIGKIVLPVAIVVMIMGVAANFAQTGFIHTTEPLKPDLKKLNPISGLKKMFSVRSLGELLKDTLVISIVGYVGYSFVKDNFSKILNMSSLKIGAVPYAMKELIISIFFKITIVIIIIAIADYIFQRKQHNKDLKMSKQEVKEEFKQDEGDPEIKSKRKQKQRELASKRMMSQVPDATVVVTNPTHLSVALKYEKSKSEAPIVVAKGSGNVALKIKEIAKENNVPIFENKPLARLIYKEVEIDSEIPVDMYQAVAEILAMVYKLNERK